MKILGERLMQSAEDVILSGKRTNIRRTSGEPQLSTEGANCQHGSESLR